MILRKKFVILKNREDSNRFLDENTGMKKEEREQYFDINFK